MEYSPLCTAVDGYVDIVYEGRPRRVPYIGERPSEDEAVAFVRTRKMLWRQFMRSGGLGVV